MLFFGPALGARSVPAGRLLAPGRTLVFGRFVTLELLFELLFKLLLTPGRFASGARSLPFALLYLDGLRSKPVPVWLRLSPVFGRDLIVSPESGRPPRLFEFGFRFESGAEGMRLSRREL